jgi:thiamine-phosphate diphosphorylase
LDGGVRLLQLRAKSLTSREFLRLAVEARELTRLANCRLVINDRLDVALACGADGVHLGQEDLPLQGARKLVREKIIGISTHDVAQARQAERDGADYIGFGPMFGTQTKDTGYAARGVTMLAEIRQAVKLPIVAIGGITEANAREVWQAGADSVAIISDILSASEIAIKVERILSLYPAS